MHSVTFRKQERRKLVRLQTTLKRLGVTAIPAIKEVNIFQDYTVIQFQNPEGNSNGKACCCAHFFDPYIYRTDAFITSLPVQASVVANTWVVSGTPQTKKLQDVLPGIINQLGPDNLDHLRRLAEQLHKKAPGAAEVAAQEDDDEVPDLVPGETFEAAAAEENHT
ncbi:Nascent polypeptide-associated complex subunit beta [Thalictrum thalictroides]|uniref:Nascent polypeptide-associated complex subunit beta n=1 Tax=Thalictrum thalictroides TaxID=46969 RepID=A0A7J6VBL2_THATH|nr:Nascent polypeptide-associated complex subunit beta [Thalictrum thalictroides]